MTDKQITDFDRVRWVCVNKVKAENIDAAKAWCDKKPIQSKEHTRWEDHHDDEFPLFHLHDFRVKPEVKTYYKAVWTVGISGCATTSEPTIDELKKYMEVNNADVNYVIEKHTKEVTEEVINEKQ